MNSKTKSDQNSATDSATSSKIQEKESNSKVGLKSGVTEDGVKYVENDEFGKIFSTEKESWTEDGEIHCIQESEDLISCHKKDDKELHRDDEKLVDPVRIHQDKQSQKLAPPKVSIMRQSAKSNKNHDAQGRKKRNHKIKTSDDSKLETKSFTSKAAANQNGNRKRPLEPKPTERGSRASGSQSSKKRTWDEVNDQEDVDINDQEDVDINDQEDVDINDQEDVDINDQEDVDINDQEDVDINDQEDVDINDQEDVDINDQEDVDIESLAIQSQKKIIESQKSSNRKIIAEENHRVDIESSKKRTWDEVNDQEDVDIESLAIQSQKNRSNSSLPAYSVFETLQEALDDLELQNFSALAVDGGDNSKNSTLWPDDTDCERSVLK